MEGGREGARRQPGLGGEGILRKWNTLFIVIIIIIMMIINIIIKIVKSVDLQDN